jgi:glutamate-ammonia-ligase adenylyltransferase
MGKLASRELTYGSDLDLIFLFEFKTDADEVDANGLPEAQAYFVRLTQRLISALQTPTTSGSCYEIDTRLRPSGNQGMLVTSLGSFERYHAENALAWERQALLRARPVAGDPALAEAYEGLRLSILKAPLPDDLASELHRVRQRMEKELARETDRRRNLKTGRGGALDVESVVEYLRLIHGSAHHELLTVDRLEVHLARLHALGILDADTTRRLHEGWNFLQRLGNRLRIVENRSISDLDAERGDLDGLARSLGYLSSGREAGARHTLLGDYHRNTESIRSIYSEVLGVDD